MTRFIAQVELTQKFHFWNKIYSVVFWKTSDAHYLRFARSYSWSREIGLFYISVSSPQKCARLMKMTHGELQRKGIFSYEFAKDFITAFS